MADQPIPVKFYNTLTRQVENFSPMEPGQVKMYVCGPTVYDEAHLGHARCYINWDVLFRFLMFAGYSVNYVRNITDVDDKIINKGKEAGKHPKEIAETYTKRFHEVMDKLRVARPTQETKATEFVDGMIRFIADLIEQGYAYQAESGTVYYDTAKKTDYGKLKKQDLEDQEAGARVDVDPEKRHSMDFALWKPAPPDDPMVWQSPWGPGRPGWHLECSTMIREVLGEQIDIHAGGLDLIFPHHENEIAQSEACTGQIPFVKTWMHNGFVVTHGEKMSKSLGNFSTIEGLLEQYDANTIRYFILTNHYRKPVDFNPEALDAARNRVEKISRNVQELLQTLAMKPAELQSFVAKKIRTLKKEVTLSEELSELGSQSPLDAYVEQWLDAMRDDLNTAKALASLNALLTQANQQSTREVHLIQLALGYFIVLSEAMGFDFITPPREQTMSDVSQDLLQLIVDIRKTARAQKNWELSDLIRDRLNTLGIQLKDHQEGSTTWEFVNIS